MNRKALSGNNLPSNTTFFTGKDCSLGDPSRGWSLQPESLGKSFTRKGSVHWCASDGNKTRELEIPE